MGLYVLLQRIAGALASATPYCARHTKYGVTDALASFFEVWLSGHR